MKFIKDFNNLRFHTNIINAFWLAFWINVNPILEKLGFDRD
mgnify:CR=1 FL=1